MICMHTKKLTLHCLLKNSQISLWFAVVVFTDVITVAMHF